MKKEYKNKQAEGVNKRRRRRDIKNVKLAPKHPLAGKISGSSRGTDKRVRNV